MGVIGALVFCGTSLTSFILDTLSILYYSLPINNILLFLIKKKFLINKY